LRGSRTWLLEGIKLHHTTWGDLRYPDSERIDYNMIITKENVQHIGQLLAGGKILAVGEYRTMKTRELKFTDEGSSQQKIRKIVEHGIEVGDQQITVVEWLADDANLEAVKPPVPKGEAVVVEVGSFSKKYGITATSIKSLASMGGKLT